MTNKLPITDKFPMTLLAQMDDVAVFQTAAFASNLIDESDANMQVFGTEMAGLETWTYPYVRTLIDDQKGEFIGIWRQVAPVKDPDGVPYEIHGTGGSWFRYAGKQQWAWQRDFFDHANAGAAFGAMAKNGHLTEKMLERMKKGSNMPGWTRREDFDWFATLADREA